jgi:NOL1/NOP2/sun family putative RNA methylase
MSNKKKTSHSHQFNNKQEEKSENTHTELTQDDISSNSAEIGSNKTQRILGNPVLTFYDFPVTPLAHDIAKLYRYRPYMIERYLRMFGEQETRQLLEANDQIEPIYIRINTLKSTDDIVLSELKTKGYKFESVPDFEHMYRLDINYRELLVNIKKQKDLEKIEKQKAKQAPQQDPERPSRIILPELKEENLTPDFTRDKSQLKALEWGKISESKIEEPKKAVELKPESPEIVDEKRKIRNLYGHQVATLGSTNEYLWGQYYIQDYASSLPAIYLNPQPTDFVIDMCAAPGSKTTQLAQLMQNKGRIAAIEVNNDRAKSLVYNLRRCGVSNTTVLNMDATNILDMNFHVDKILLDVPCSGEGIIRDDPSRKQSRSPSDIVALMRKQSILLLTALKAVKSGGYVMYSTCSIAPEENEFIVQNALETYKKAEVVAINDNQGLPGYPEIFGVKLNQELLNTRRYFPHIHNSAGFFLCLLHKKV